MMSGTNQLITEAKNAPDRPGVYLFKDGEGRVLYVGKAKSLKKRVRSYFGTNPAQPKTKLLVAAARRLDYYVTDGEIEALVLECNLIKQYRPRYNVSYRDDKTYPYLAISMDEDWPRLRYTREKHRTGTRYFGPYTNAQALREALDTLLKIFPLRTCSDSTLARAQRTKRQCLYYHIARCPGPCVSRVEPREYARTIERIGAFLEGRQEQVIADLTKEMEAASERLEFERAAAFRDRIKAAAQVLEKQRVSNDNRLNQDIFGAALESDIGCVQLLKVRAGKLVGSDDFIVDLNGADEEKEILTSFIKQFYDVQTVVPDEIVLPAPLEEPQAVAEWLGLKRGRSVKLTAPRRGLKRRLVDMAVENAHHSLARHKLRSDHESKKIMAGLLELQQALGLSSPPATIECFDISNTGGSQAVGSMVVFSGGRPSPKAYKRFKVRLGDGSPNDFAMMREVVSRRLKHVGDARFAAVPDLIIVDGGKPQLKAALEAMADAGEGRPAVAALAKKREELFVPGRADSVRLADRSAGLYLIQRIRDEAHRFAVSYHRHLRSGTMRGSGLDTVPGIGPKRRRLLLKTFGSLKNIGAADENQLVAAGLPRSAAKAVKARLTPPKAPDRQG
jgi:excinuclease ABC subunit C